MVIKWIHYIMAMLLVHAGYAQSSSMTNNADTLNDPFDNTVWNTGQIIGITNFRYNGAIDEIKLIPLDKTYPYGNITQFKNNHFTSRNQGPCGNECRMATNGIYKLDTNKIELFINTIHYEKECADRPTDTINQSLGIFYWVKDEFGLRLLKSLKDEPTTDYFMDEQVPIPIFDDEKVNYLMRKYVYVYNRCSQIIVNKSRGKYKDMADEYEAWRAEAEMYVVDNKIENEMYHRTIPFLEIILQGKIKDAP